MYPGYIKSLSSKHSFFLKNSVLMLLRMRLILICHCVPFQFSCNFPRKTKKKFKMYFLFFLVCRDLILILCSLHQVLSNVWSQDPFILLKNYWAPQKAFIYYKLKQRCKIFINSLKMIIINPLHVNINIFFSERWLFFKNK